MKGKLMVEFLVKLILDALIWLIVVPAVTNQRVKVNGGLLAAIWCSFLVCVLHYILWIVVAIFTVGLAIFAQVITFGLIGVFITAGAIHLVSSSSPDLLQVRGGAFMAALTLVVLNAVINYVLHTPGAL